MNKPTTLRVRILATAFAVFAAVGVVSAGSAGAAIDDEFQIEQPCWWDDSCTGDPGGGGETGEPDDDPDVEVLDSGAAQPVAGQPTFTG